MKNYMGMSGDYQYQAIHNGIFIQRVWHLTKIYLVEEKFLITPRDAVVEIGCGSGNLLVRMAERAQSVMGVDLSEEAIQFAQQLCAGFHNVSFQINPIAKMKLPDHCYTKAICQEVIEHLLPDEIEQLISKTYQALRPGGEFLITTPNYRSLWPLIEYVMDTFNLSPPMRGHMHLTKFHMKKLEGCLRTFKFEIVAAGGFNALAPWVGFLPERLVRKLNRWELDHSAGLGSLIYVIARKPVGEAV